jgi:hypothetical protein
MWPWPSPIDALPELAALVRVGRTLLRELPLRDLVRQHKARGYFDQRWSNIDLLAQQGRSVVDRNTKL